MKKSFPLFGGLLVVTLCIVLSGCSSNNEAKPTAEFAPLDTDTSESDIREQKPKFLDYMPVSCHLANTGDTNYIRIITNSEYLQKVWMVYYDHKKKEWETLTWTGSGAGNKIIKDTVFNTIYGIHTESAPIEDPTFYMAWSKDQGRTWHNHPIERTSLRCSKGNVRLLVSADFDIVNAKPDIAVIIRSPVAVKPDIPKSLEKWDDSYLCALDLLHYLK